MTRPDFAVTIFHNPNCGTSRNVLAALQQAGLEPHVVRYLDDGWTRDQLKSLAADAGVPLRDLLRDKGTPAAELGLLDDGVSEEALLAAMVAAVGLTLRRRKDTKYFDPGLAVKVQRNDRVRIVSMPAESSRANGNGSGETAGEQA